MWTIILFIVLVLCGAGYYYFYIYNAKKKIIALYANSSMLLVLPELIKTNLTVTSTPALQNATVENEIGTPGISITGLSPNTLYTFSISGYDKSNAIYTGLPPPTPTPTPGATPLPPPKLTVTKTDTSVTITHPIVANATSYQYFLYPLYNSESNILPNPFTYKVASQTTNTCTFSNITPYLYQCAAQATSATWTTDMLLKEVAIPLIINNPIIAVCDVNYTQVYLYFNKDVDKMYDISSVTATPALTNSNITDSNVNLLKINSLTANTLYRFSINGITGNSNLIFMGQGSLASANVTPVITKVSANSFTASIPAVTGATSYQFIVYDNNLLSMPIGYLYSAVTQSTSTMTYSNVPNGTYVVTIQASNSTGTKVGVSSSITIPQP